MNRELISIRASDDSVVKLEYHERLDSVASLAKEYAENGYPDRYAVLAEYDNAHESNGRGIYMSLILRPSIFPSQAGFLSSLSAVALILALDEHTTKKLGIGWVSSIYCGGKHIGAVTTEGKLDDFTSYEYIIINFSAKLAKEDFPHRITDLIKKVFESDNTSVAIIIARTILSKFFPLYSNIKNPSKFMNKYKERFALGGVKIKYNDNGKKTTCKALGVNPTDCALIVEMRDKSIVHITKPNSVVIPKTIKKPYFI